MSKMRDAQQTPLLPFVAAAGLLLMMGAAGDVIAGDGIVWHDQGAQRAYGASYPGTERVSVREYTEYRTYGPQGPTTGQPVRVEASAPPPLPYKPYPETEVWRSVGYQGYHSGHSSAHSVKKEHKAGYRKHAAKADKHCNCAKISGKSHGPKAATRTATSAPAGNRGQQVAGISQYQRLKAVKQAQHSQVRMPPQRMGYSTAGAVPVTVVTPDSRVPALIRPTGQTATIVRNNAGDPGAPGWESRTRTVTTVAQSPVAWQEQRSVSYVDYGAQPAVWGGPIYPGQAR